MNVLMMMVIYGKIMEIQLKEKLEIRAFILNARTAIKDAQLIKLLPRRRNVNGSLNIVVIIRRRSAVRLSGSYKLKKNHDDMIEICLSCLNLHYNFFFFFFILLFPIYIFFFFFFILPFPMYILLVIFIVSPLSSFCKFFIFTHFFNTYFCEVYF